MVPTVSVVRHLLWRWALICAVGWHVAAPVVCGDIVTTTFASNAGRHGNMFNINVLNPNGITLQALQLNLDPGNWNLEFYTIDSTYVGNQGNPGAWTLRETVTGLSSAGLDQPTQWDLSDFALTSGVEGFYIRVANGPRINYTTGTTEGALYTADGNLQVFEGTSVAGSFGGLFGPAVWNGSIIYLPNNAIPEPSPVGIMVAFTSLSSFFRRRTRK